MTAPVVVEALPDVAVRVQEVETRSSPAQGSVDQGAVDGASAALQVVSLSGELDIAALGPVLSILVRAIREGRGPLAVDLSDVQFMDATGLRCLLAGRKLARKQGRRFHLVEAQPAVRRVFEIVGLGSLLETRGELGDDG